MPIGIAGLGGVNCNAVAATGANPFTFGGPALTGYANPVETQNDWGFAVQGGVKVNMPWIAPGDVFYVQATYEQGALGYILGNTLAYTGGFWASSLNYGNGLAATPSSNNWVTATFQDCVWTLLKMREATGWSAGSGLQALLAAAVELGVLWVSDGDPLQCGRDYADSRQRPRRSEL